MTTIVAVAFIGRFIVGAVFVGAALLKLINMRETAALTADYSAISERFERVAVIGTYPLTAVELAAGAALLLGRGVLPAATTIAVLLAVFTGLMVYELWNDNRLPNCGCYGVKVAAGLNEKRIVENLFLLVLTAFVVAAELGLSL